jgi:nonribosomal peptide synthetase DhbF
VLGGFVAAPLSPASGPGPATARLRAAWELCGHPPVIVGATAPGPDGAWPPAPQPRLVTIDSLRSAGQAPDPEGWYASGADDVFTILFTSGSTGVPKAAALTHRNVLTMINGYIELEGLGQQEVTFNWMPLDHAGGLLAFHLRDVYLGCDQVHASPAAILADPLRWLDWLDRFRATCTWAPNFAFSLINDQLAAGRRRDWDLSRLHHIMTAGEMIVAPTVRRFLGLLREHGLPPSAVHPSWGMSETSGGVTFSSAFRLVPAAGEGRFVELGRIVPGAALRVVDDAGNVLPDGEPGRIQVNGPTVTPGYFRNPEADKAAFTPDGWFDTGDIGLLREGRLTMTGRAKDIIIVNGLNYYCHEIEAAAEEVPGVVVTCTAAAVTGISPQYLLPVDPGVIPRTETGKIRREKLRQLFDRARSALPGPVATNSPPSSGGERAPRSPAGPGRPARWLATEGGTGRRSRR